MLDYKLNDAEQETVINKGSDTTIRYDEVEPVAEIYMISRHTASGIPLQRSCLKRELILRRFKVSWAMPTLIRR